MLTDKLQDLIGWPQSYSSLAARQQVQALAALAHDSDTRCNFFKTLRLFSGVCTECCVMIDQGLLRFMGDVHHSSIGTQVAGRSDNL